MNQFGAHQCANRTQTMPKTPYPLSTAPSQVIRQFVRDGDSVALEGFTHLIPFAAGHEIIGSLHRFRDALENRWSPIIC
jgi:hypothetical protein